MINRNERRACRSAANLTPPVAPNGCHGGCHNPTGNASSCQATKQRLQALDFSIVDTVLYLDAYPDAKDALQYYHKLLSERDALSRTLAENCRMPMTSFENASKDSWDWVSGPWPWEADAN